MITGFGLPVFSGVAIGPAVVYRKAQRTLPIPSGDPVVEKAKFDAALETAREQLTALFEKAKVEIGEEQAAIVEVQLLMLDDLDYLDGVAMAIEGGAAAAIAALETGEEFAQFFASMAVRVRVSPWASNRPVRVSPSNMLLQVFQPMPSSRHSSTSPGSKSLR